MDSTYTIIFEIVISLAGTFGLIILKGIRDDIKDIQKELKEHGNRLTAIETGLKMFEWFSFKKNDKNVTKVVGDE